MPKEDFKGIASLEEIMFTIWGREYSYDHDINIENIQEIVMAAWIVSWKSHSALGMKNNA